MSVQPLITFKAGKCGFEEGAPPPHGTVQADPTPGFLYFWQEDDLMHFCWRKRTDAVDNPTVELFMIAGDARFLPYTGSEKTALGKDFTSPGDARVCVLKFLSSGERHLFYLQSFSQHPDEKPNWFSQRDLKQVKIIDELLAGKDISSIDVSEPITFSNSTRRDDDEDDEAMEDAEGPDTGGAGPGATGGDFRQEGEGAREGGEDGARAAGAGATDASTVVQNFLNSLKGGNLGGSSSSRQQSLFTTLSDLLAPDTTVPVVQSADDTFIDSLLSHVPPAILLMSQEADDASESASKAEPNQESVQAAIAALSSQQKRDILLRILRSPQLSQSLSSLTAALRDGGLPSVAEALRVPIANGGLVAGGTVPLGGGDAVEAFLNGIKKQVEKEDKDDETMDTS